VKIEPDWARAVALARRERGVWGGRRGLVFTALLVAGLHAATGFASLGAASDVPVAQTREVDVMRSIACLAILICSSSFATDLNLVVGGDFESVTQGAQGASCHSTLLPEVPGWDSNLGWQVDRFQNTGCIAGCIPLHAGGGQYSISLQGSVCCGCNNNGFIEQTVQTVAGARYRLTFDTVLDDSDALRVSLNGDDTVHVWNGELQWRSISREFVATGTTLLRFASEAPSTSTNTACGGCWEGEGCMLDNIRLVQIPTCPADVIQDGVIDGADLAAVLTVWGTDGGVYPRADTNADGIVDGTDLAVVLGGWGACP
jgi:Protein of unknown function (DUF642)